MFTEKRVCPQSNETNVPIDEIISWGNEARFVSLARRNRNYKRKKPRVNPRVWRAQAWFTSLGLCNCLNRCSQRHATPWKRPARLTFARYGCVRYRIVRLESEEKLSNNDCRLVGPELDSRDHVRRNQIIWGDWSCRKPCWLILFDQI